MYHHTFQDNKDPADVSNPKVYCEVLLKAVIKEKNGKTVRPSHLVNASDWSKDFFNYQELQTKGDKVE
jgi:hypothetical protein